ncbi:hypothetical protein AT257_16250 [Bacillus cereus]|uniref:DNA sulfur modification protein DndB n=1 Tax=Bacillus mycoides TaxID=1405 RepID=UPI00077B0029|nr:DNA sulfur modification protein DndB [Bacillus mycoides]KXY44798.1 hypothetical protein AT257_16250 [Bacillus cereus]MCZ6940525.1 DGQHR domain-containing protein [Bacillus mycoides]
MTEQLTVHSVERKQPGFATPSITVPAIAYFSGNRIWYAITVPYGALKSGLVKTSSVRKKGKEVIMSDVKNRFLDKAHKDDIKRYMQIETQYTIPPVTLVSMDKLPFEPIVFGSMGELNSQEDLYNVLEKVGSLGGLIQLPMDYQFECLDGNHRSVAIRELAEEMPEITQGSNLLLNIVCEDNDVKIRQDFVDVNKNAKATTASINTLFNTRDPLPNIVSHLLHSIPYLEEITDVLAVSISKNSTDIYTLNNIKNSVVELSGIDSQGGKTAEERTNKKLVDDDLKAEVGRRADVFFKVLESNFHVRQCLENRKKTSEIRAKSLITLGVGVAIAAHVANYIFDNFERHQQMQELERLNSYDWDRTNVIFNRSGIVAADGSIITNRGSITKTKAYILSDLGYTEKVYEV